jgi:GAF domain-containing protein/HAMP domain-containing protein
MNKRAVLTSGSIFASFKDWPIAGKLLLVVLVPVLLTLVTTLTLTFTGLNRLEAETSAEKLQQDVLVIRQQFAEIGNDLLLKANELTADPILLDAVQRDDRQTLQGLLLSTSIRSGLSYLEVVDTKGQTVVSNRNFDLDETPPELKRLHNLGLLQITDAIELVPTPAGWLMATVRPIKLQSGEVFGALSIGRLLDNSVLSTLNFERTNPILAVFDAEGHPINVSATETESNLAETFQVDRGLWAGAANGEILTGQGWVRDELQRVAYAPLVIKDKIGAVFGLALSTAQATQLRNQLLFTNLAVVGILGVLTILAAFFLGRNYIVRPVTALASGAEQIAAGQLEVEMHEVTSRDEIGMLAAAFNKMTAQLRETLAGLEDRTQSLEVVSSISDRLVTILNLEELLVEVVNQLKDRFGYYHVHIYLLDDKKEKLIVAEGTGTAGAEMKEKGHSIRLDAPTSLVARAARIREVVKVDNVRETADWLPNPLLPNTYSEMALPIILEGEVVGVLDVQQDKIAGLDESDVNLLHSLANQVAIAIRNARQFAKVETALTEAHEAQRRYVEQAWEQVQMTQQAAYQYQRPGVLPLSEAVTTQVEHQVLAQNQLTVVEVKDKDDQGRGTNGEAGDEDLDSHTPESIPGFQTSESQSQTALVAPIRLQNQTIGVIQLYDTERPHHWTERELALVEAVTEQIAQMAENLRLFEETRERAGREATIREITDKLRAAPTLDMLLETAARELGQRLGVRHTVLEMGVEADDNRQNGPGDGPEERV